MKKLYGLMGFTGFIIIIGSAGGADSVSFAKAVLLMISGLALVLLSLLLVKSHNMRAKRKRYLYMKRRAQHRQKAAAEYVCVQHRTPKGISQIISEKINSPELC